MDNLITVETLIKRAKDQNINFGKGDPYNRLRYYTKIGWLPHMVRKDGKSHYPTNVLDKLITIEKMKETGADNDAITKELIKRNSFSSLLTPLKTKEVRAQIISIVSLVCLLIIVSSELGIIRIGRSKSLGSLVSETTTPSVILDKGVSFIPEGQREVSIRSSFIPTSAKVYVTFNQDYTPASRFWVSHINAGSGFTLEMDAPVANDSTFSWWVTN
jgi:hypothetical protein